MALPCPKGTAQGRALGSQGLILHWLGSPRSSMELWVGVPQEGGMCCRGVLQELLQGSPRKLPGMGRYLT